MTDLKEINFMNNENFEDLPETEKESLYAVEYYYIPDYTAPVTISSSPFTIPSNGVITYNGSVSTGGNSKNIYINGSVNLDGASCSAGFMSGSVPGKTFPVKEGDIITYSGSTHTIKFFPYVF